MYAYVHSSLLKVLDEDMYQRYIIAVQDESEFGSNYLSKLISSNIFSDLNITQDKKKYVNLVCEAIQNYKISPQITCSNCCEIVEDGAVKCDNCGFEILSCDIQKKKKTSSRYNRIKHFMKLLNNLQGICNNVFKDKDLQLIYKTVHYHIERDKLKYISYSDVRCYLKECRLSKYNRFIPYIKRLIGDKFKLSYNICTLTDDETYNFISLYKKIDAEIVTDKKINFSFIIRKLAGIVITDKDRLCIFLEQVRDYGDDDELLDDVINEALSVNA